MKYERIYNVILEALKKEYGEYRIEEYDDGGKAEIRVEESEDSLWGYTITIEMDT